MISPFLKGKATKKRLLIWWAAVVLCAVFSALVLIMPGKVYREYEKVDTQPRDCAPYELPAGGVLMQRFTAMGKTTGEFSRLYVYGFCQADDTGALALRLYQQADGREVLCGEIDFASLGQCEDLGQWILQAEQSVGMREEDMPQAFSQVLGQGAEVDGGCFYLKSGIEYCLELTNTSEDASVVILGNRDVYSGQLTVDGQVRQGVVDLTWTRFSLYSPSKLLPLLVLLTDATVLLGLAMVLFTQVKVHTLYLVLALGFGFTMLFDLTPLYGFDMRFQFDSTYVLSNQLLGQEGLVELPSPDDPEEKVVGYYRRACDDYSQYQFYYHDEVSANYTDMKAGLRSPLASEEERRMVPMKTDLGFVSDALYMYLPQAIGFSVARLLGLGMFPMLQLARALNYGLFVACAYFAIKSIPFGKRLMLILSLMPAVLVQEVSLSRDAMIISLSFFVIAKVLELTYGEGRGRWYQWALVLVLSVVLAPCKMVYLPISCLCLMAAYKQFVLPAGRNGKRMMLFIALALVAALAVFVAVKWTFFFNLFNREGTSIYDTPAYTLWDLLADPAHTLLVIANTLRDQMGEMLVNGIQLFNIDLGSSDGVTLIIGSLLLLEVCSREEKIRLHPAQRGYLLLVAAGVFLLLMLAAFRWTPADSEVFVGLQGRYLIPIFPLLGLACYNNSLIRVDAKAGILVKAGCCVFPAISLMNMYLWTIAQ